MAQPVRKPVFSAADYLAWEAAQAERHEFVAGEVFAMAGAEDRHVTVAMNLAFALRGHLDGGPCRTYMSDMRLFVAACQSYFYPDVLVTCSDKDRHSRLVKTEPALIIEVLSPGTRAYDRGLKLSHYCQLPSLQEYLLIDIDSRCCELHRLGADGLWVLHTFGKGQAVTLASVGLSLSAAQIFAQVPDDSLYFL